MEAKAATMTEDSKDPGRGVAAKATTMMADSKDPGRGVAARAKGREVKARGWEGPPDGAARAERDPTVQAGRQGSGR